MGQGNALPCRPLGSMRPPEHSRTEEFKAFAIQLKLAELKDPHAHRSAPRAKKYSSGEHLIGFNSIGVNHLADHQIITSASPRRH